MCEQQTLMFTQAYCRQPSRRFSVFFGLRSGGAGTMEFQYHNCLFLYVSLKQQVKKKKKSTMKITKQNCFSFFLSKDVIYNHYTNREEAQRGGRNKVMFQRFSLQGPHTKLFFSLCNSYQKQYYLLKMHQLPRAMVHLKQNA